MDALQLENQRVFTLEELRARLRPYDLIDDIFEIRDILKEAEDNKVVLSNGEIRAHQLRFEINSRMLRYAIPELKSIDHTFSDESKSKVQFILNMTAPPKHEEKLVDEEV